MSDGSVNAPPPAGSPVADAYARPSGAYAGLEVVERAAHQAAPRGAGWVVADALAAGGAQLDDFLAWDEARILGDHGRPGRPDVVASFGLNRYAWPACLLITLPWFPHRRVPRLPVRQVAFHRTRGLMSVHVESFTCLPDDPVAALPGAHAVPDEEALRGELRAAVAQHLAPLPDAFGPRTRRGRRAPWGAVGDEVVSGPWHLGKLLGEEHRATTELEVLLAGGAAPHSAGRHWQGPPGGAGFRTLRGPGGEPLLTRNRASCCLFHTVRPEDTCVTCPRTCDADRIARLTAAA